MQWIELKSVDSTNVWARDHLANCDQSELTVIVTDEQTAGRGQYGRYWYAPPGQLIATFVFFIPQPDRTHLVQLLACVLKELLEKEGLKPAIRWPNDLLINGKKVAGILVEVTEEAVIMGLGLNLALTAEDLQKISQPATSLLQESGRPFERDPLLRQIAESLWHQVIQLRDYQKSPENLSL